MIRFKTYGDGESEFVDRFCKRTVYPMEILRNNFHVGTLNDDGEIHTEDPELAVLAHRLLASNLSEKLSLANRMIQLAQR